MKGKVVSGIILTMLLITMGFNVIPVLTQPTTKIGVIGPWAWPQGDGMVEGATLARDEINAMGGVDVGGTMYPVELIFADEFQGQLEGTYETGAMAMEYLMAEEVDFVIGGFRTAAVFGAREVAMDYQKIFIITGAATDELIDCGHGTCGACVRCNYDRYKYVFRATPPNETTLIMSLAVFLGYYVIPQRLLPLYGEYLRPGAPNPQVKVAVIAEDLHWTEAIYTYLTNPAIYPFLLGPYANVTYSTRVPFDETDLSPYLTAIIASEARLIVHLFSGPAGVYFILQWGNMEVEAVPVGINEFSQLSEMWGLTAGKCEYEAFLASSGRRTPITGLSTPFWDSYVAKWGHDPIYTAFGAYDAVYALKEAVERAGTTDSDAVVVELEQTDRIGTVGNFKFTGSNPNHPGVGTLHDVFVNEIGPTWTQGFVRPLVVQWQAGVLEVVWPQDQPYSKEFLLPSSMATFIVSDVTPYKAIVGQGQTLRINVTVSYGGPLPIPPTFITVAAYYDNELIQEISFMYMIVESITLTFTWNTTGVAKGNYTISARADNNFADGWVTVVFPGDLTADGKVDIDDVVFVAICFGSYPGQPKWDPNADINDDDKIDIDDVVYVALRFGTWDP